MRARSARLFLVLFFIDAVISLTVVLVGQFVTTGLDAIFYNPLIISLTTLIFMVIESYVPFVILFGFIFRAFMRWRPKARPIVVCAILFVLLLILGVGIAAISFGTALNLIDILIPGALAVVNAGLFAWRQIWAVRPRQAAESD